MLSFQVPSKHGGQKCATRTCMGVPDMEPDTSATASALLKVPDSRSLSTYALHWASIVSVLSSLAGLRTEAIQLQVSHHC